MLDERHEEIADIIDSLPVDWPQDLTRDPWAHAELRWRTKAYRFRGASKIVRDDLTAEVIDGGGPSIGEQALELLLDRAWRVVDWKHPRLELKLVLFDDRGVETLSWSHPIGEERGAVAEEAAKVQRAATETELLVQLATMTGEMRETVSWSMRELRRMGAELHKAHDRVTGVAEHLAGMRKEELEIQADVAMHQATEMRRTEQSRLFADRLPLLIQLVTMVMSKTGNPQTPETETSRPAWISDFVQDVRDDLDDDALWSKYELHLKDMTGIVAALRYLDADEMQLLQGRFGDLLGG